MRSFVLKFFKHDMYKHIFLSKFYDLAWNILNYQWNKQNIPSSLTPHGLRNFETSCVFIIWQLTSNGLTSMALLRCFQLSWYERLIYWQAYLFSQSPESVQSINALNEAYDCISNDSRMINDFVHPIAKFKDNKWQLHQSWTRLAVTDWFDPVPMIDNSTDFALHANEDLIR